MNINGICIVIACSDCKEPLTATLVGAELTITPCPYCLESERSDGRDEGYDEGYDDAIAGAED